MLPHMGEGGRFSAGLIKDFEMNYFGLSGWTLRAMTNLSLRGKGRFDRRREGRIPREAETEVMQPQAGESWQPLEAGRSREQRFPGEYSPVDSLIWAQ